MVGSDGGGVASGAATFTSMRAGGWGGLLASQRRQMRIEEYAMPMEALNSCIVWWLRSKASTRSRHF